MNAKTAIKPDERVQILNALQAWINQRPGLEFGNYGDVTSYRAELRSITKDLHQARTLLRFVELRESITAEMLKAAFKGAFSGRLSWEKHPAQPLELRATNYYRLEYCTGQYWPTEYRRAACAVLASAIWSWFREGCMPEPDYNPEQHAKGAGHVPNTYKTLRAGDYIRRAMRREFGRAIASRWFN